MNLFWVLLSAHICGDVLSYSPLLSKAKRSNSFLLKTNSIARHCLVHAGFVLIVGWVAGIDGLFVAAGYIFVVHFGIDWFRIQIEPHFLNPKEFVVIDKRQFVKYLLHKKTQEGDIEVFMQKYFWTWLGVNITDQGLHLASMALFVWLVAR